jgi:hypothetical protein
VRVNPSCFFQVGGCCLHCCSALLLRAFSSSIHFGLSIVHSRLIHPSRCALLGSFLWYRPGLRQCRFRVVYMWPA